MEALGIGGDRIGARSRIMSRLTSKPRKGVLDNTAALNAARDAVLISEQAAKASWTGGPDTITAQTLPPHPLAGMHKALMREEAERLFKAQTQCETQLNAGADRRRHAGYRVDEAIKESEASGLRVWGARGRMLGIGAHKLGWWVMAQWFLQRTIACVRQWYLNMRCEQGSLKLLYLMMGLHRDYIRENLLLPWRGGATEARKAKANEYQRKRKGQRQRWQMEKAKENKSDEAAAKAAQAPPPPIFLDVGAPAKEEFGVPTLTRIYYGI